jgi:hypothetical protein
MQKRNVSREGGGKRMNHRGDGEEERRGEEEGEWRDEQRELNFNATIGQSKDASLQGHPIILRQRKYIY